MLLVPIFSIYRNVLPPHTAALRTRLSPFKPPSRPLPPPFLPRSIRLPSHPIGSTFPMAINNFETAATFRGKNKFSRLLDWKKTTLSLPPRSRTLFGIHRHNRDNPLGRALARYRSRSRPPSDRLRVTSPQSRIPVRLERVDLVTCSFLACQREPRSPCPLLLTPPLLIPFARASSLLSSPSVLPATGHRS